MLVFILCSTLAILASAHEEDTHESSVWTPMNKYVSHIPNRKLIELLPALDQARRDIPEDVRQNSSDEQLKNTMNQKIDVEGMREIDDNCLKKLPSNVNHEALEHLYKMMEFSHQKLIDIVKYDAFDPEAYYKKKTELFDEFHHHLTVQEEDWLKENCELIYYLMLATRETLDEAFARIEKEKQNKF